MSEKQILNVAISHTFSPDALRGHGIVTVREGIGDNPVYPLDVGHLALAEVEKVGLPVGILKRNATDGNQGVVDSVTLEVEDLGCIRMIKEFAGKKDIQLQRSLKAAIDYIARHPRGDGSERIKGLGGNEPTFNHQALPLWRFKPGQAQGFRADSPKLRLARIVYAVIDSPDLGPVIGLSDIVRRDDMTKEYN